MILNIKAVVEAGSQASRSAVRVQCRIF